MRRPPDFLGRKGPSAIHDFLAAADAADAIPDPLQRCLAYPDPPRTRWSHAIVAAYCDYLFHPVVTVPEIRDLVAHGRGKELDERLTQALRIQLAKPGATPLLDQTYYQDFFNPADELRPVIDNWKRQSPRSAFAFAASGFAYLHDYLKRHPDAYEGERPSDEDRVAMTRLLPPARADLDQAVALEPRLTAAYAAMVQLGLYSDRKYALDAASKGLAVDPSNFAIYNQWRRVAQPVWGGSKQDLSDVIARSQAVAGRNPLLLLLKNEANPVAQRLECGCNPKEPLNFSGFFDQPARWELLQGAGVYADGIGSTESETVYLSEANRFGLDTQSNTVVRLSSLYELNEQAFAIAFATRYLATHPRDAEVLEQRAAAYSRLKDRANAIKDMQAILSIRPDDVFALSGLGHYYVLETNEPDKAMDIARQLLRQHPEKSDGWFLKAAVDFKRSSPEAHASIDEFMVRFGKDEDEEAEADRLALMNMEDPGDPAEEAAMDSNPWGSLFEGCTTQPRTPNLDIQIQYVPDRPTLDAMRLGKTKVDFLANPAPAAPPLEVKVTDPAYAYFMIVVKNSGTQPVPAGKKVETIVMRNGKLGSSSSFIAKGLQPGQVDFYPEYVQSTEPSDPFSIQTKAFDGCPPKEMPATILNVHATR